jgi:hypothetical protein
MSRSLLTGRKDKKLVVMKGFGELHATPLRIRGGIASCDEAVALYGPTARGVDLEARVVSWMAVISDERAAFADVFYVAGKT